jgi:hypothetical protein
MNMKLSTSIALILFSAPLLAQQSYIKQHSSNDPVSGYLDDKSPNTSIQSGFVGCVDYKVTYKGVETTDEEALEKTEFLVANTTENYGTERTRCFNEVGDWVVTYKKAKHVDKVWYFAETNEEYTLFQNGVLKFSLNSEAEPEGFYDLGIKEIEYSDINKSILNYNTQKITVEIESGTKTEYWISDKIIRLPASYEKNKLGYTNQIMELVKGIHLYQKQTVGNLFITIEEAVSIDFEKPDNNMFLLPAVDVYHW